MLIKQKHLFNNLECKIILSYVKSNSRNWDLADRKYESQSISCSIETSWLFDRLRFFFETETGLEIKEIKKQIHFHRFIEGDWFNKHNDTRDGRIYAVGVLLNDNFFGGDFKLYNPNEQILNKKTGNAYLFDVRIEHEVTQILEGERYSLLWFLKEEQIKLKIDKLI